MCDGDRLPKNLIFKNVTEFWNLNFFASKDAKFKIEISVKYLNFSCQLSLIKLFYQINANF